VTACDPRSGTILIARMNRFRVPLILMLGGFAAKGAGILAYRLFRPPGLLRMLTTFDPAGFRFAEAALPLFFDLRGIAPPPAAHAVFEVLLVIGFAVQCFILGLALSEGRRLLRQSVGR
jgi:hypothetical protein